MNNLDTYDELAQATHIEEVGIRPTVVGERNSTARHQFWIWAGVNLTPLSWVIGTFGAAMGLSLVESIAIMVSGQFLGVALFGLCALMGHRTGVNQMVLARATFGRHGAYLPAALQIVMGLGFIGINSYFIVQVLLRVLDGLVGREPGRPTVLAFGAAIMLLQVAVGVLGFYALRFYEKLVTPVVALTFLAMTALVIKEAPSIAWTTSTVTGADKFTAATQLMTAAGIGWGMSWVAWAADMTRFTLPTIPDRKVFAACAGGMFASMAWLAVMGAMAGAVAANAGVTSGDPADIVIHLFGGLGVPVLILMVLAPIGTNVLNLYSAALGLLSLDIKMSRAKASVLCGLVAAGTLAIFTESQDLATGVTNFISSMVVWFAPWVGVTLVDHYVIRRGITDIDALYLPPARSRYGRFNGAANIAFLVGLLAAWTCQFGLVDAFQGVLAEQLGGVDLSWLVGLTVSATLYFVLARSHRETRTNLPGAAEAPNR